MTVGVMAFSFCVTLIIVFAFSTIEIDKYKMLSKVNNTHEVINNETVISLNKPCMGIVTICVSVCVCFGLPAIRNQGWRLAQSHSPHSHTTYLHIKVPF